LLGALSTDRKNYYNIDDRRDFVVECCLAIAQDTTVESAMNVVCTVMSDHPDGLTTR
jgi:hypothetical protein